jgi:hypothetical protein
MTDIEKILSCIGQPVRFTFPEGIRKAWNTEGSQCS